MAEGVRSVAVTGANGFVGSSLVDFLRSRGFRVFALGHRPAKVADDELERQYSLEGPVPTDVLGEVAALIHCAYDFRLRRWHDIVRVNVEGSRRLFEAARAAGVKAPILVSTISAFQGCQSNYGRAKLRIEAAALDLGAWVVRPGLVFGGEGGGALGPMNRLVSRSPIVPLVGGGSQRLHLVHRDDLCELLLRAVEAAKAGAPALITAAAPESVTLREIVEALASAQSRRVLLLPLSWRLIWAGLRIGEVLGIRLRLGSDSLRSLMNPPAHLDLEDAPLGVRLRTFAAQSIVA